MGNTIGSSPRPVTVQSSSPATAVSNSAPAAAPSAPAAPPDSFSSGGSTGSASGPAVHPPQSAEEIRNMGIDQLKQFKPEEIKGMSLDQFQRFQEAVDKNGGMDALDPEARKAMFRKQFMKNLADDMKAQAEKHQQFNIL